MGKSPKKTSKVKVGFLIVGILFLFLILHTCSGGVFSPLPYRSLAPFEGKVIVVDTKKPIKQAVVLAVYYIETYTVAGSNSTTVDGQEVLTDENGEFKIPRKKRWFVLERGYPEGALVIFKPGYGVFPRHKRSVAVGVNKSWPPPRKYIVYEIPKLKTRKERNNNILFSRPDIPSSKMKNFIRLLNEELISLGYAPYTITKEEK